MGLDGFFGYTEILSDLYIPGTTEDVLQDFKFTRAEPVQTSLHIG